MIEGILWAALAVAAARLLYALVTPVGPLGAWRPAAPAAAPVSLLGAFDPFFRLSSGNGTAVVTTLDLTLFGIRADQASGRGSAIIGLPDGHQQSYAVGEEIVPGVTLKAVAFDGVTIERGGREEQLFLDQSQPATRLAPPPAAQTLAQSVQFVPRVQEGEVAGLALQPAGDGAAFRAAGLQSGDVLVALDGRPIAGTSPQDIQARLAGARQALLGLERGGQPVTLRVEMAR